jgi:hypothetical protein
MVIYTSRGARRGTKFLPFGWWGLGFLWSTLLSFSAWAQAPTNPCDGTQDNTADLQAAVTAGPPVNLTPGAVYCVNGNVGVNLPTGTRLYLRGATVAMNPGCARSGFVCRILNFMPNTTDSEIVGPGEIIGDDSPGCAFCWSINVRVDGVRGAALRKLRVSRARSDLVWIGGNTKPSALLEEVVGMTAGRNLVSIVNSSEVLLLRVDLSDAYGPDPGACLDIEGNPGDTNEYIAILWSRFRNCKQGVVHQKGQGNVSRDFVAAWNNISDIKARSTANPVPSSGLTVNGVRGVVLFRNTIVMPPWSEVGPVPLAGTIAGNSLLLASEDAYMLHTTIEGGVNNRGTPNPADDVFSGNFRLTNVRNFTAAGNSITNGVFTSALSGVVGDDVRVRNVVVQP